MSGSDYSACRVWGRSDWRLLKEVKRYTWSVQFTGEDGIVAGCCDGVVRTFDADYEPVEDQIG